MANVTISQHINRLVARGGPDAPPGSPGLRRRLVASTPFQVLRYTLVRALTLLVTLVIGVFIAVWVANLGGFIDDIVRDRIEGALQGMALAAANAPPGTPEVDYAQLREQMIESAGLNQPFLSRTVRWTYTALRFEWSNPRIVEALPNTLLLFGTASLILFFTGIGLSLFLSRHYGTFLDRLVTALSPISSIPSWAHGILLIMVFSVELHLLPFSGIQGNFPPATKLGSILVLLKHMILPVMAILLSIFFQAVYAWRAYFVLHSEEDHVVMATAMGLSPRTIERRDVLRPALPYLITSFTLLVLGFWQSAIVLEYFFTWPGIGSLYVNSLRMRSYSPETAVSLVVIFAYILAITVFLLDVVYSLVDPRVRLANGSRRQEMRARSGSHRRRFRAWLAAMRHPRSAAVHPTRPGGADAPLRAAAPPSPATVPLRRVRVSWIQTHLKPALQEIVRYPSAFFGLAIIVALVASAVTTMLVIPYQEVIDVWRGGAKVWYQSPAYAQPVWVNLFRAHDLPPSVFLDSRDPDVGKQVEVVSDEMTRITISFPFEYHYNAFPRELVLYLEAQYERKKPHVAVTWLMPDGREIEAATWQLSSEYEHHFSQDERLQRRLDGLSPTIGLFADPASPDATLPGRYEMRVTAFVFEPGSDVDARFVLLGRVHGLAGTDHMRRDLIVPLLWGMPIALAMGLLGAVTTSFLTMFIAAAGAWYGGWVDSLIQRITEINIILPLLPICIMVYFLYDKSVWLILGVAVLLSIFGTALKSYRAAFMQVREAPYIDAARAYGAGNTRIVVRYLVPRILPILVPQLVMLVPAFVFLEATLAILGVSDPYLPTWGKVIYEGLTNGAFAGHYYWVLEPIGLLLLTGFAFALLGFALERILEPRLRDT
ncbi:MAG TPA: ABC transporter permease subunit [Anaerolineae bacterium]|nr:ABC transporter permease subunit [Anaerolineae bacterium]